MKQQVIFVCYFTLLKNLYGYVITQGQTPPPPPAPPPHKKEKHLARDKQPFAIKLM